MSDAAKWIGGLAEWREGDTVYLSIAFTWRLNEAYFRARYHVACGRRVRAGGPALFIVKDHALRAIAEVGDTLPDAVAHHNPDATVASRGCPVGCSFCIVPKMEGKAFTLLPDFPVRPILCDNNLSALPAKYQNHIIERYRAAGVKLRDANSGFEPMTFTPDVRDRWAPLIDEGGGPWRFAYDETKERKDVLRVMKMLADWRPKRKRVYVLIGNEPFAECMARIQEVIDHGCEPYVQSLMKLKAPRREPWVRFDWTKQKLADVQRWIDGYAYRKGPFSEYDRRRRNAPRERYDATEGLFRMANG